MKLITCLNCNDIVSLSNKMRTCECKRSYGRYTDHINAIVGGPCIVLGIDNGSFKKAKLKYRMLSQTGNINMFVIDHKTTDTVCGSSIEHDSLMEEVFSKNDILYNE